MRCIHCGKEIRDGVVFCIHCDRPIKKEYAHYSCEFYDSFSIAERIATIFASISDLNHKHEHKSFVKYNHRNNTNSQNSETVSNQNGSESDDINLDEITDSAKQLLKKIIESPKAEKKIAAGIIIFLFFAINILPSLLNFSSSDQSNITVENDGYYSDVYYSDELQYIDFPIEPKIYDDLEVAINNSELGSSSFVITYLQSMCDGINQREYSNGMFFSTSEFENCYSLMQEIIKAQENDYAQYEVYDELVYLTEQWRYGIEPMIQNSEAYDQDVILSYLNDFSWNLIETRDYYLYDEF
jgi:hypothetical protein